MFDLKEFLPKIKVIGVGSRGVRMLKDLKADISDWAELIAIDTDLEILNSSNIPNRFHIAFSQYLYWLID